MTRIVYRVDGTQTQRGGHKVAFRHVEALNQQGFDACVLMTAEAPNPTWFDHAAPVIRGWDLAQSDIIVLAEDSVTALRHYGALPNRKVVFAQNHIYAAANGLGQLSPQGLAPFDDYMACSETVARWLSRLLPHGSIDIVPAFADERLFRPAEKSTTFSFFPGKRDVEVRAVLAMAHRLYRAERSWAGFYIVDKSEAQAAALLGKSSIFISFSRLEGFGMATLEAMAAGCLVVGFSGIGGREYATPDNGIWVDEDDCEACADALCTALRLVEEADPRALRLIEGARATAARYTYARFVRQLCRFWESRVPRRA